MIRFHVEVSCGLIACQAKIDTVAHQESAIDHGTIKVWLKPNLPEGWTLESFGPRCPAHRAQKY